MKLRIHGDIETPYSMYGIRGVLTYPPFSFPTHKCVIRENDHGEEYPKYVVFDFEVDVKDAEEAKNLKNFIEAFLGTSDGSFKVEVV
ncbi:hypothetical protein C6496_03090 [Candidatus Poribacteria bacterium]|nr:MAG: hypothetical protein C6496_03090 [Candidatus Poribacteria bacterium]